MIVFCRGTQQSYLRLCATHKLTILLKFTRNSELEINELFPFHQTLLYWSGYFTLGMNKFERTEVEDTTYRSPEPNKKLYSTFEKG